MLVWSLRVGSGEIFPSPFLLSLPNNEPLRALLSVHPEASSFLYTAVYYFRGWQELVRSVGTVPRGGQLGGFQPLDTANSVSGNHLSTALPARQPVAPGFQGKEGARQVDPRTFSHPEISLQHPLPPLFVSPIWPEAAWNLMSLF